MSMVGVGSTREIGIVVWTDVDEQGPKESTVTGRRP